MTSPSPSPLLEDLNSDAVSLQTTSRLESGLRRDELAFAWRPRRELNLLGCWETVVPAAIRFPTRQVFRPARSIHQAATGLIRDHAVLAALAPDESQLAELENISAAVVSATSTYDAAVGHLLSLGWISCEGPCDHQPLRVLALPTGELGNILCLHVLTTEHHGWGLDKSIWLEGPSMRNGESGYWNEEAAPIQQVCFAQSEDRHSFLAVRLPRRTVLFHPVCGHVRKPVGASDHFALPPSPIAARPIGHIAMEQTGGTPHADVAFNPHNQRQFGLVDQRGNWSVWHVHDGDEEGQYTLTCNSQHRCTSTEDEAISTPSPVEDGWARILWLTKETIAVYDRRQIAVFDVESSLIQLESPRLIAENSSDWILDVKKHPKNKRQCYVLTSSRLFLLNVYGINEAADAGYTAAGATTLDSWCHFRSPEDITLQLSVHSTHQAEFLVFVHSRLNALVTTFRFEYHASKPARSILSSDPTLLRLDGLDPENGQQRIIQFHLEPLYFGANVGEDPVSGPGQAYSKSGIEFYQLSALLSDLTVRQVMLYSLSRYSNREHDFPLFVEPTSWTEIIRSQPEAEVVDDFIVPDMLGDTAIRNLERSRYDLSEPVERQRRRAPQDSVDYRFLYDALLVNKVSSIVEDTLFPEPVDMSAVVAEARQLLVEEKGPVDVPLGTLLDFAGLDISLSDVDETSSKLQDLLPLEDERERLQLQRIACAHVLNLADGLAEELPTVSSLYDTLLQNWIMPLPTEVPIRARQSKERLSRRIAAEAVLASLRIRRPRASQEPSGSEPASSRSSVSLSNTSFPPPGSARVLSSLPPRTSKAFSPTPSPAITPGYNPLSSLSEHLLMGQPQPITVAASINEVLMHWQPGADPATYDWEATESNLQDEWEEDREASQVLRDKARRKKQRQEKRQEREEELFRGMAATQPQPQPPTLRSSPGPTLHATSSQAAPQSQSQPFGGFIVQSQVEPGRHGGRPSKKKVKNRISGF